jgi:protein involved in polysaccharide export with SLBB domain
MKENLLSIVRRGFLLITLSLIATLNLSAQQGVDGLLDKPSTTVTTTSKPAAAPNPDNPHRVSTGDQYRIGPKDILAIRVAAPDIVPQFSSDAMEVNECGFIPLLSVQNETRNEIRAAGMTTNELQEQLRQFYTKYKRNPQVVVKVKEYNSQPVAINGAVVKPGQFQLRRPVRLLELLQFYAGGPKENSGGRIQIARMPALGLCESQPAGSSVNVVDDTVPTFLVLNLSDTLKGIEGSNPYLQPGDVITLPEAKEAYVIGNVLRPGPVVLKEDNLTVSQAIARAGGTMPDSKKDKVRIIRQEQGGSRRQEILVNLNAIDKHQAEDVALLPNDIIEVPTSGSKRLLRSLVGAVIPAVGQLPVRVIP